MAKEVYLLIRLTDLPPQEPKLWGWENIALNVTKNLSETLLLQYGDKIAKASLAKAIEVDSGKIKQIYKGV